MYYKLDGNKQLISAERVITPNGELTPETLQDGWIVAGTSEEALALLNAPTMELSLVQFHSWLQVDGLYDGVVAYIESMPEGEDKIYIKNLFYKASVIKRNHPLFEIAKTNFGLTDEYIDGRFAYWGIKG